MDSNLRGGLIPTETCPTVRPAFTHRNALGVMARRLNTRLLQGFYDVIMTKLDHDQNDQFAYSTVSGSWMGRSKQPLMRH